MSGLCQQYPWCFNPRPRAGGDFSTAAAGRNKQVSIHAPAQGATTQSALVKDNFTKFQSTPPRRGRRVGRREGPAGIRVSIHAPAQGATCKGLSFTQHKSVSIHAPAQGATMAKTMGSVVTNMFQSTPPRRGRPEEQLREMFGG